MSILLTNKKVWESKEAIAHCRSYVDLQKPEKTILRLLQAAPSKRRVLDIGVGGGRTTNFFSESRDYIGIDYSADMITACRERFSEAQHVQFSVCDARDMRMFMDHFFDFVLFSFNGIDNVEHDDRLRVFREVRRVLRPKGWFAFSSHNLQSASELFQYFPGGPPSWPPWRWALISLTNAKRRALNPRRFDLLNQDYAILNDWVYGRRLSTYFVKPRCQIEQLTGIGFSNLRYFSLKTGIEISSAQLENNRDPWLYYLCEAKM